MLLLVGLWFAIEMAVDRQSYLVEVKFHLDGLLVTGGVVLLTLWCGWCAMPRDSRNDGSLAAWFALQTWAMFPLMLVIGGWLIVEVRRDESVEASGWFESGMVLLILLWYGTILLRLGRLFFGSWTRAIVFAVGSTCLAFACYFNVNVLSWALVDDGTESTQSADPQDDGADDAEEDEQKSDELPEYLEASLRELQAHRT